MPIADALATLTPSETEAIHLHLLSLHALAMKPAYKGPRLDRLKLAEATGISAIKIGKLAIARTQRPYRLPFVFLLRFLIPSPLSRPPISTALNPRSPDKN